MAADSEPESSKEELAVERLQEPVNAFDLSPEQQDTASLLNDCSARLSPIATSIFAASLPAPSR